MQDPSDAEAPPQQNPSGDQRIRPRVLALVWFIPALFSATVSYGFTRITGNPVGFWNVLTINIPIWYFWAFATPAIFWLGRVARVSWPVKPQVAVIHLLASVVAAVTDVTCGMSIAALLGIAPLGDHVFKRYLVNAMSWLVTGVLTYWAILGAGYALDLDRKYQRQRIRASQLAAELARAQLSILRNQLHPHFLFNTLNTAAALVRVDRSETAVRVLTDLGDILRRLLHNAPDQEITLREEIEFLNAYIAIEKIRFAERLTVNMCVPEVIMGALVPNLLLQPLVENAIRYGIGQRNSAGHVEVSATRQGGKLVLQVRDDGPGLPSEWNASDSSGVGLTNTQERLQQMYGPLHEFLMGNASVGGAEVTITIPFHLAPTETEDTRDDAVTTRALHA